MNRDFYETTIGDQITFQRGFDITKKDQVMGSVPVVSSGGISSYHNDHKVDAPGVVIGRKGTLGTVYYLDEKFWPHDTSLWIKDFKGNFPRYVYYFLLNITPIIKKMDVGAANPTLNRNHIHPMPVLWPSLNNQKAIAHILGKLDDKIELNRQMNQTLEAMAQALFKSWFVDFDPVMDNAGFWSRNT
jgi:type I restriction enzyme S subunit